MGRTEGRVMPKEVIYDQASIFDTVLTWETGGGGYVQIGTKMSPPTTDSSPRNLYELVQSWVNPQPIVSVSGGTQMSISSNIPGFDAVNSNVSYIPGTPHEEVGDSLWCTLDRDGINRLIRALRRARDQAFGADA